MGTYVTCSSWGEHGGYDGISTFKFNEKTGELSDRKVAEFGYTPDAISGSAQFIDKKLHLIYMVDEIDKSFDETASGKQAAKQGDKQPSGLKCGGGGSVVVWRYGKGGSLKKVQQIDSYGSNPAMVTISPDGKYAVVAHHGQADCATQTKKTKGGYELVPVWSDPNIVLFRRKSDGTIDPSPIDIYQVDEGKDEPYKKDSWRMSHSHSCVWAPQKLGNFFIVCDKGTNHIYSMRIAGGKLKVVHDFNMIDTCAKDDPCLSGKSGAWAKPRYVRFHPTKRFFFVNYEAANQASAFSYTANGDFKYLNSAAVVDMSRRTANNNMDGYRFEAQDLRVSSDGKYLYDAYRCSSDDFKGHTRIHTDGGFQGVAVFEIDQRSGKVKRVQNAEYPETPMEHTQALYAGTDAKDASVEAKGYYWPRGLELSPDGKYLLIAFLHGDWIASTPVGRNGQLDVGATKKFEMNTPSGFAFFTA